MTSHVSVSDMSVSLAYVSVSGITRDTDMSTFMGLSPNKDLKNGLIGCSQCSWHM